MTAGIPGTGIGGLYYLLLAFLMPLAEVIQVLRGRSSWKRWLAIGMQLTNACGIIASLMGTSWLLRHTAQRLMKATSHFEANIFSKAVFGDHSLQQLQAVTSMKLAWLTIGILAAVIVSGFMLRIVVGAADHWFGKAAVK